MTSGTAPQIPESGWRVLHSDELATWLTRRNPSLHLVTPVVEWIHQVETLGPPLDHSVDLGDERFMADLADGRVVIEYAVIEYEYLVIVRAIT